MKVFLAALCLAAFVGAAEACTRTVPASAQTRVVPERSIDQALFDAAVRQEVNYHRCRAGLRPMAHAGGGMIEVAQGHSSWMAKAQRLSHQSGLPGRRTHIDRMKAQGQRFTWAAENISRIPRFRFDGKSFRVVNQRSCDFESRRGRPIPPHSYASLARLVVDRWMVSPGHRRNILNPTFNYTASAVAFDPRAKHCGRYWITQNLVG